jgi:AcrR family transcriptional regulator
MPPGNAQNALVKECMVTALLKLMQQKRYEDISITDIAKKAGVSRMSFYRNYTSKDDIVHTYFKEKTALFSDRCKEAGLPHDAIIISFLSFVRDCKDMIQALIRSGHAHLIQEDFDSTIRDIILEHYRIHHDNYRPEYYNICFIIGGLQRLLIEWAKNGMMESDAYMAELFTSLQYNISALLNE